MHYYSSFSGLGRIHCTLMNPILLAVQYLRISFQRSSSMLSSFLFLNFKKHCCFSLYSTFLCLFCFLGYLEIYLFDSLLYAHLHRLILDFIFYKYKSIKNWNYWTYNLWANPIYYVSSLFYLDYLRNICWLFLSSIIIWLFD